MTESQLMDLTARRISAAASREGALEDVAVGFQLVERASHSLGSVDLATRPLYVEAELAAASGCHALSAAAGPRRRRMVQLDAVEPDARPGESGALHRSTSDLIDAMYRWLADAVDDPVNTADEFLAVTDALLAAGRLESMFRPD